MNAHARKFSVNRRPDAVIDAEADLSESPLGIALLALLELAASHDLAAARREATAVMNGRRHSHRATPVERLAARLLNDLGPPEDCYVIREVAASFAMEDA